MRVFYLLFLLILIVCCRSRSSDNSRTGLQNYETSNNDKEYFLICTDPVAYSHHKDYDNENHYCSGLKTCIRRGYKVERMPASDAFEIRKDPCDFCYGRAR